VPHWERCSVSLRVMTTPETPIDDGEVVTTAVMSIVSQLVNPAGDGRGRAEQVEHQVEAAIRVGILSPGDKLPPEPVFADQLGVATLTLRQSLASLRARGFILTRRGRGGGSYVNVQAALTDKDVDRRLMDMSTGDIRDMTDHAAAISICASRLAAERTDAEDITRLRNLAARLTQAKASSECRLADSRFQIGLAVAAQSPRLTAAMAQVQAELSPLSWGLPYCDSQNIFDEFNQRLIDAIERAEQATAGHIAEQAFLRRAEILLSRYISLVAMEGEVM